MERTRLKIMARMWIICVITILFFIILAPSAFAKETLCDCWCQTNGGAVPQGKLPSSDACQSLCKKNTKLDMATCAYNLEQYPASNLRCFTKEFCELKDKDGKIKGEFDTKFQPPECLAGQRYCYPNPDNAEKLKLNIAIGNKLEIGNLGEYINTMYAWMLGVGITFAIVMAMVGGMQYVLAAGSGNVAKGKEKITNAVVGIVLLSATYLILFTVNPQLLKLQVPQLPMMKQVNLIQNSSCGDLESAGYNLQDKDGNAVSSKKCGDMAKVVAKKDGSPVAEGTTCQYKTCPNPSIEKCLGSGSKAKCLQCAKVIEGNAYNVIPSSSVCSQLSLKAKEDGSQVRCGWTKDSDAAFGGGVIKTNFAGNCAEIRIKCGLIKKCEDYDNVKVYNTDDNDKLSHITDTGISSVTGAILNAGSEGDFSLTTICQEDPCKIGGKTVTYTHGISGSVDTYKVTKSIEKCEIHPTKKDSCKSIEKK